MSLLTGAASQLVNTTWCIGDSIVYICNLKVRIHTWNIGKLKGVSVVIGSMDPIVRSQYTLRLVNITNGNLVSSLSVDATADVNNTALECIDGVTLNAAMVSTIISIFGMIASL